MSENPMFLRQRLRERFKKAREATGLTQREVATAFGWSPSKVIRIESGRIGLNVTDAMALVSKYEIGAEEGEELIDLARKARQPSWYAAYKDVMTPEYEAYVAYEESASIVRNFERNVIPGLLQTEEYARSLYKESQKEYDISNDKVEKLVELRIRRQVALESDSAEFHFILDESVIHRVIGSEEVMRQQFETLLQLNELDNVNIHYVPYSKGAYPQFRNPYQVFEFTDADDLVAYLETQDAEVLLNERAAKPGQRKEPADYLDIFLNVEKDYAEGINRSILFGDSEITSS
ncbi:helix-turn-helix domain-containing protein [Streptomyces sp. NPDC055210]